jgi:TetR/AcrR family transcriptional regulator, transcriptional repressor for nem operon
MQEKLMRYRVEETAAKHERIVKEASRLFREKGFDNVSVGEVMKAAGLTHGAFYAHFGSKEQLQAAAVAYGQEVSLGRLQRSKEKTGKGWFTERYLGRWHRDNPGDGCTMAALAEEVGRSTPELKAAFDQGLENMLSAKGWGPERSHLSVSSAARWRGIGSRRAGSATLRGNPQKRSTKARLKSSRMRTIDFERLARTRVKSPLKGPCSNRTRND